MTAAVDAARAALLEVGRGDLADRVYANRRGWPHLRDGLDVRGTDDQRVVVKAFLIGHWAGGHGDSCEFVDDVGRISLWCPLCSNGLGGDAR